MERICLVCGISFKSTPSRVAKGRGKYCGSACFHTVPSKACGCRPGVTLKQRLWENISIDRDTGCWIWTGHKDEKGYGHIGIGKKSVRVHRVVYERYIGPIPEGLILRHKCDIRNCVRPDHLILGTQKQNVQDMIDRGRHVPGRGEKHWNSILNNDSVTAIKVLWETGNYSLGFLGRAFRVNYQTIGRIINHGGWNNVSDRTAGDNQEQNNIRIN